MEMASYLKGATGLMAAQESEAAKLARKSLHVTVTLCLTYVITSSSLSSYDVMMII
jgi:hypothetical protein